jgi:transketolase
MRNAFAAEIAALADKDERVVLLMGDIGNRLFNEFRAAHPERFFNCGVAEANMTSMAAGMASCGLRPFTYTITPFATTRCLEQIRDDICYHHVPVVVVGVGAGLSYASLGATHHSCEDIAFLRALPGMIVVCPADAVEVRLAMRALLAQDQPAYLRMGKKGEPVIHQSEPRFVLGKVLPVQPGKDVCLLAAGTVLPLVLETAAELAKQGITAEVVSFHTIKPLDEEYLRTAFDRFRLVATVEEHGLIGGLGSAVAEWLIDLPDRPPGKLLRFGSGDHFLHEAGDQEHARRHYGLTAERISQKITQQLAVGN